MIRMIFAGQLRGTIENWKSNLDMIDGDVNVYVGSYAPWDGFIEHQFYKIPQYKSNMFATSVHTERHVEQWSNLSQTYEAFKHLFNQNDTIIKTRNDLLIQSKCPLNLNELKSDTIYVPSIEFHEKHPFDKDRYCNDQIIVGTYPVMNTYFNMYKDYRWEGNEEGIESVLRKYLIQQNIKLETFEMPYIKKTIN